MPQTRKWKLEKVWIKRKSLVDSLTTDKVHRGSPPYLPSNICNKLRFSDLCHIKAASEVEFPRCTRDKKDLLDLDEFGWIWMNWDGLGLGGLLYAWQPCKDWILFNLTPNSILLNANVGRVHLLKHYFLLIIVAQPDNICRSNPL